MSDRLSLVFWESCVFCALVGCSTNSLELDSLPPPARAEGSVAGDTLIAVADAHLRSAAKNLNSGTSKTIPVKITVGEADTTRAIVKFDQAAIVAALGSRTLTGATLGLAVKESGTAPAGNDIDVHRVRKPWTEAGVTWKCGEDLNTANVGADCPTTKWKMDGADMDAFVATRTARVHLSSGQNGPTRFDVTSDVQAFLAGGSNHGWLVNAGSATSRALLWSREAALKPSLVLSVSAGDTTTPPVPTSFVPPPDSTRTVPVPSDPEVRYHRHLVGVIFDDSTSGTTINALLGKYQATIVGGFPGRGTRGAYMLQIPDTVTTYEGLQSLVNQIGGEVGVDYAFGTTWRDKFVPRGRYPDDGAGSRRSDWTTPTFGSVTAPWRAIRAPLAWGCETGAYGSDRVPVGIIDWTFDTAHPDLASSTKSLVEAPLNSMAPSVFLNHPQNGPIFRSHGTAVTGVLAAQGGNGIGIAGMLWRADLKLYAYGRGTDETQSAASFLADSVFPDARRRSVRVLLTSLGAGLGNDTNAVRSIRDELRLYLEANNGSLLIVATGGDNRQIPIANALATAHPTFTALDRAALELYSAFPRQIIFVTGTNSQSGFRSPANGSQYTGDFYQVFNLLWSHSGLRLDALYYIFSQRAIDEANNIETTGSRLYSQPVSVATGVTLLADQMVDNVVAQSPGYLSADDTVLFLDESPFGSSSCSRSRRQLTQLTTLIGTTLGCFGDQYFPMGRLMAALGDVSGRRNKAAGELKRRTLPTPAENGRAVLASQARRVRVN